MVKKRSLNIVLPVYNEEKELQESVMTLYGYLSRELDDYVWRITIVDNASTDNTYTIAKSLGTTHERVRSVHLDRKGRGRAVKYAWQRFTADINAYMDIDLSTDLQHFPSLIRSLTRGYDIAIGSRNAHGARVYGRNALRTITSKGYIALIKLFFWVHFSDAQCGFKAVTRRIVDELIPVVDDNEWFFDSELLITGEKLGYRIYEEPVTWIDNPGSTVRVMRTAQGDLEGLWRIFMTQPWNRSRHGQ
ncbi:glycosyltransferase [Candidatus Gottesmanbacteria bacterium]|nr:glycosyltransferase [Candidatus Gottesmanbacteria bacterium]